MSCKFQVLLQSAVNKTITTQNYTVNCATRINTKICIESPPLFNNDIKQFRLEFCFLETESDLREGLHSRGVRRCLGSKSPRLWRWHVGRNMPQVPCCPQDRNEEEQYSVFSYLIHTHDLLNSDKHLSLELVSQTTKLGVYHTSFWKEQLVMFGDSP